MECEAVRRAISDGDGRVLRARKIRAHVRACRGCRDFERVISTRTGELHTLAPPLPAAAATAILARLLTHGVASGHSGAAAAASGAAFGNHVAASVAVKALATVAFVSAATAGAVHIVASPARHRPIPAVTQRSTPLRSGVPGARERGHAGRGATTTLRPGSGATLYSAPRVKSGKAQADAKAAAPGAAAKGIGGRHTGAGGKLAPGRGRKEGGSSTHVRGRHSSPAKSQTGHGSRPPATAKPAPRQQTASERIGQMSMPATEHAQPHGGLSPTFGAVPNSKTETPLSATQAAG